MCNGMCSVVALPVSAITGLLAFGIRIMARTGSVM